MILILAIPCYTITIPCINVINYPIKVAYLLHVAMFYRYCCGYFYSMFHTTSLIQIQFRCMIRKEIDYENNGKSGFRELPSRLAWNKFHRPLIDLKQYAPYFRPIQSNRVNTSLFLFE